MKQFRYVAMMTIFYGLLFSGAVLAAPPAQTDTARDAGQKQAYIVKYRDGAKAEVLQRLNRDNAGIRLAIDKGQLFAIDLPENALAGLRQHPMVEYIEVDQRIEWFSQTNPYANVQIQADQIGDSFASNMKVCIIDTGVQTSHEDLNSAQITGNSEPGTGVVWDQPVNSHGTYMAGAVFAQNNAIGVQGALPNGYVQLHAYQAGGSFTSSVVNGLYDCQANGSNIVSMSLGLGKNRALLVAVRALEADNILLLASSGNSGSSTKFYPATYPEVIAVGAVDRFEQIGLYSSFGAHLELVAAGDAVLGTTLMGQGRQSDLAIGAVTDYEPVVLHNSILGSAQGNLVDCGTIQSTCPAANSNICLIEALKTPQNTDNNGNFDVTDQVLACENEGALAAVLFNDVDGVQYAAYVTIGATTIPVATISNTEMTIALASIGQAVTLNNFSSNYIRAFGTSISAPYAASAAALAWSHHPNCSSADIRQALAMTAKDLGVAGRDDNYGFGLVQAAAAKAYLDTSPCGTPTNQPPVASFSFNCMLLDCTFDASASSDSDGSITSYDWDFGDGATQTGSIVNHVFATDGNYTVNLVVTDNLGANANSSQIVSVSANPIQLAANGYKFKGKGYTDLSWSGANGPDIKIYRNNVLLGIFNNSGLYTDFVGQRGTFIYRLCELDDVLCSYDVTVTF